MEVKRVSDLFLASTPTLWFSGNGVATRHGVHRLVGLLPHLTVLKPEYNSNSGSEGVRRSARAARSCKIRLIVTSARNPPALYQPSPVSSLARRSRFAHAEASFHSRLISHLPRRCAAFRKFRSHASVCDERAPPFPKIPHTCVLCARSIRTALLLPAS